MIPVTQSPETSAMSEVPHRQTIRATSVIARARNRVPAESLGLLDPAGQPLADQLARALGAAPDLTSFSARPGIIRFS